MSKNTVELYSRGHWVVVALGVVANLFLALGLLFATSQTLSILQVDLDQLIWAKFSGGLLFIITCYYVPELMNLQKFRLNAWMSALVIRGLSALFFALAVLFFLQQPGFLMIALLDLSVGAISFILLYKLDNAEAEILGNPLKSTEINHQNKNVRCFLLLFIIAFSGLLYVYCVTPAAPKYIW